MGAFDFFKKRNVKNVSIILSLVAQLSAFQKEAKAIEIETIDSFLNTKSYYVELLSAQDDQSRQKASDDIKKIISVFLAKLENDVKKDLEEGKYNQALDILNVILGTLENMNQKMGNLTKEIKIVKKMIQVVADAREKDQKKQESLDYQDILFVDDKGMPNHGIYSYDNNVFMLVAVPFNGNLSTAKLRGQGIARKMLIKQLRLGKNFVAESTPITAMGHFITKDHKTIVILVEWVGSMRVRNGGKTETINAITVAKTLPTLSMN